MAPLRFCGGIVVAAGHRAWLVADPGAEVHASRRHPAEPVVVGPPDARKADVDRARREARRLLKEGGPLAVAAGIDCGAGFRTAVLEGGEESRRDAVLAAVELLGVDQLDRVGERGAVLVALFGPRATRRVGKAAMDVLARGQCSSLRLAVAASDLLNPEQLEDVLALAAPAGTEPVPREHNMLALADQLQALLGPSAPRRRLALIRSLWDDVVRWQTSATVRARARRRRVSQARLAACQRDVRHSDDEWWRLQAQRIVGLRPTAAQMLAWTPDPATCWAAVARGFQEAVAATTILRIALAAEDQPVETAVLDRLDQLAYAATCHSQGVPDRAATLHRFRGRGCPASDRAGQLACAALLASDPGLLARFVEVDGARLDRRNVNAFLGERLRDACELAHAVYDSSFALLDILQRASVDVPGTPALAEWRGLAGYGPARDPRTWNYRWLGAYDRTGLMERLARAGDAADPAKAELLDDGLWFIDLADALAAWYGHERANTDYVNIDIIDVDPPAPPADPRSPLLESIPLAVAGAAQLVAIGATPPPRRSAWGEFADGLVQQGETLGLSDEFEVAEEVAAWDGRPLPATDLVLEVARTPQRLAEWGNWMGNCIAEYADTAKERFALLAAKEPAGKLVANISIMRGGRRWRIDQALARFNEQLPEDVRAAIGGWVESLPVPSATTPAGVGRAPGAGRGGRRGRRPSARERLGRATAALGGAVGELEGAAPPHVLLPIAVELGWSGDDGDWLSPFVAIARPRRAGPLAAATARALADGASLAEVWHATGWRPLASAIAGLDGTDVDLGRLAATTVPDSLRPALRDPRVWSARVLDLAALRVRVALGELLAAGDARLDEAVVRAPHTGFVTAGVLVVTAGHHDQRALDWISVDREGVVPGRPRSTLSDPAGPWAAGRAAAAEMGAAPARVDEVLADAPGRFLVAPQAWVAARGWSGLWARAHRIARETAKSAH